MTARPFEAEDPMELTGMVLPGAPGQLEAMAEVLVEEYARMGWSESRLMTLFVNPHFLATHRIYRLRGEAWVRHLVRRTCRRWRCVAGGDRAHPTRSHPDPTDDPPRGGKHG